MFNIFISLEFNLKFSLKLFDVNNNHVKIKKYLKLTVLQFLLHRFAKNSDFCEKLNEILKFLKIKLNYGHNQLIEVFLSRTTSGETWTHLFLSKALDLSTILNLLKTIFDDNDNIEIMEPEDREVLTQIMEKK